MELRYAGDDGPGITRLRAGTGFRYLGPSGRPLRDPKVLARIKALAIPPAYRDVWISPFEDTHVQATGRDARGRKQYRYHPRWREQRDATKYAHLLEFAKALPAIRRRVARDLRGRSAELARTRILAAVVRLLETTAIRVGNDEYARANDSYGLTTLRNAHARVRGASVQFRFRGKSGIRHAVSLRDRALARIVHACQELPGQRLFEYVGEDGNVHAVDSHDVNAYIREISGGDFTAKDFRTWLGTVECAALLRGAELLEDSLAQRKRALNDTIGQVARRLGNTPAVCRKCYVHPAVTDTFLEEGTLGAPPPARIRGLSPDERFTVAVLRRRARETPQARARRQLKRSLKAS